MATRVASLEAVLDLDKKNLDKGLKSTDRQLGKAANSFKDFGRDAGRPIDQLAADVKKASEEVGELGKEAESSFGGLTDSLGGVVPGLDNITSALGGGGPFGLIAGLAVSAGAAIYQMGQQNQQTFNAIEARTGATGAELQALGDTAKNVFKRNFGENMEDVVDSVIQVKQVLGETGTAAEESAIKALTMRDVFGIDIPESLRAVRSANKQFGDEAATTFDMMATLIQRVGDPAQDLADTINEYSADFAQAGFSQAEMFGILEAGVANGARNFDVIADAVREFTIRIVDGSDTTRDALNKLFAETGHGGQEFFALKNQIEWTTQVLDANTKALADSKGAYEVQQTVIKGLETELAAARRQLDELARPNLKGVQEFDDKLFALDQRAKSVRLGMLDLEKDTPEFEAAQKSLDAINKELDRVALQRDLTIEPQLRAIEKAAQDSTVPAVTFGQAMEDIANQKDKIAGIADELAKQQDALEPLAFHFENLANENERLTKAQEELKARLEATLTPADQLIQKLGAGLLSQRDAMSVVVNMLGQVEDQVIADQLAVALFGSKAEELGVDIITALDPAVNRMEDFEGATNRAAEAMDQGLGPAVSGFWRKFSTGVSDALSKLTDFNKAQGTSTGLGELLGFGSRGGNDIPSMGAGGIVPGPIGSPQPIIAHGGEEVTPVGGGRGGGVTVIVQGSINGDAHLQQTVMDAFNQLNQALAGATS